MKHQRMVSPEMLLALHSLWTGNLRLRAVLSDFFCDTIQDSAGQTLSTAAGPTILNAGSQLPSAREKPHFRMTSEWFSDGSGQYIYGKGPEA